MSFTTAMLDRGRRVGKATTGAKVEGTKVFGPETGEWFRCRVIEAKAPETLTEGEPKVVTAYEFLYKLKDENGDPVVLGPQDKVEIESSLGNATYQLQGRPEIMRRRKNSFVGGYGTLQLVQEPGKRA